MFRDIILKIKKIFINEDNWHEDFIVHIAKVIKPNTYVELWLYKCELFNRIIPHANELIWVDLASEPGRFMKKNNKTSFHNMTTDDYYEIIKKTMKKNRFIVYWCKSF